MHVEAVAVGWCGGFGPGAALPPAVRVHHVVAGVGVCAAPLQTLGSDAGVAEVRWDALRGIIGVEG